MTNNKVSDNFYLYQHRRLDTNEIFYVGIGSKNRSKNKTSRNNYWKNIVNKTDYSIEILFNNLNRKKAIELEIQYIKYYGRKDLKQGLLVNRTNGGDGNFGLVTSDLTKEKQRKAKLGSKQSIETIIKKNNINSRRNCYKSRKVINIETKKLYSCIQDAAEDNNINYGTLKSYLCGSKVNKTNIRYYE